MDSSVEPLWPEADADPSRRAGRPPLAAADQRDRADLQVALDQLNLALAKANRRIHRLQGEREQLTALLERRDDQIERLNRELGRHVPDLVLFPEGAARSSGVRAAVAGALFSMSGVVGPLLARWQNGTESSVAEIRRSDLESGQASPLGARRGGDLGQPVVGVILLGLGQEDIERLLPIIERDCSSKKMKPLCLVDLDAFELLRTRGLIFEYLPPMEERDRFDRSLHWDLYLQRRLAIVRRKWNPVRVVAFGTVAMKTLTLWSSSPFEDKPLPTALADQ